MHIISFKTLRIFFEKHPSAEAPLKKWFKVITANDFKNVAELKQLFPSADQVKKFVVFNIGGNKYRLIAFLAYEANRLYVRNVLTHKEYDKDKWKEDTWFSSNK